MKRVYSLNYFGLFVHPPHFAIFLSMYYFLSKCFYSHLHNKWACQKPIPSCLINYLSICVCLFLYVSTLPIYWGLFTISRLPSLHTCLSSRWEYSEISSFLFHITVNIKNVKFDMNSILKNSNIKHILIGC